MGARKERIKGLVAKGHGNIQLIGGETGVWNGENKVAITISERLESAQLNRQIDQGSAVSIKNATADAGGGDGVGHHIEGDRLLNRFSTIGGDYRKAVGANVVGCGLKRKNASAIQTTIRQIRIGA